MDLKAIILQVLLKPKVVHDRPGSLEVHIPVLSKIDPDKRESVDLVTALLAAPDGIDRAEIDLGPGHLLLTYDGARWSSKEVLGYLEGLIRLFLKNRESLENVAPERVPEVAARLAAKVKASLGPGLTVDAEMVFDADLL